MSEPGRISDEGVAQLRARIGIPEPHTQPPHYRLPNVDTFRHVAESYGDDNPLWSDVDYARTSVWGGIIAPPPLVGGDTLIGEDEIASVPDEYKELMRGDPLRGVHAFYASSQRHWWAPLRPGHRVWRRNALVGVLDKESEFAGRAIHEWMGQVFQSEDGCVLGGQYRNMVRTDRRASRERKKYDAISVEPYSEDELSAIDAQYAAEGPRGASTRWWEDVEVGQTIGPMVKGPLTLTDMVCWHVGMGTGMYGVRPLRLGYKNRQRIPRFYTPNELGIPDVQQRVHWEPEVARRTGNPTTYDYGRMRETWLIHLCTDWMGDEAWLWKLDCQFRMFNYVGDTHWLNGAITKKYVTEGDRAAVDIDLSATNQRGVVTTPGSATILLPSRRYGAVRLPEPPGNARDLEGTLAAIAEEFSTL
jgi:acyl dehydratase